jgi:hypothetical protein
MGINSIVLDVILASRLSFNQPLLLEEVFLPTLKILLWQDSCYSVCHSFPLTFINGYTNNKRNIKEYPGFQR